MTKKTIKRKLIRRKCLTDLVINTALKFNLANSAWFNKLIHDPNSRIKFKHRTKRVKRSIQTKLVFMNQIIHLEETALARQIQLVQDGEGLPGLTSEVRSLLEEMELPNLFEHTIPPTTWKIWSRRL